MKNIIIVGHGNFATGLSSTLELISGKFDYVKAIDFTQEKTPESLKEEVKNIVNKLNCNDTIYCFTDLLGGTPFKVCSELKLENDNMEVIAGTNIAMLIETSMAIQCGIDIDLEMIKETGKMGITSFNMIKPKVEEDFEDGI